MEAFERLDARIDSIERVQHEHGLLLRGIAADLKMLVGSGRTERQRIAAAEGRISDLEARVDGIREPPCVNPASPSNGGGAPVCPVEQ